MSEAICGYRRVLDIASLIQATHHCQSSCPRTKPAGVRSQPSHAARAVVPRRRGLYAGFSLAQQPRWRPFSNASIMTSTAIPEIETSDESGPWLRNLWVCLFGSFTTIVAKTQQQPNQPHKNEEQSKSNQTAIVQW